MPHRPPTHAEQINARRHHNQRYAYERRVAHGPDPRSTARWRRVRALVLATHPLCVDPYGMHRATGRVELATEVDHTISLLERPDLAFDTAHLQPLCTPCHARKSRGERAAVRGPVWLICGPPASGKSTYVAQHQRPYDLVLDLDRFIAALSSRAWDGYREFLPEIECLLPYAVAAYQGVIERLHQLPLHGAATWVIGTLARRQRRQEVCAQLRARCVVLAVPYAECVRRVQLDPQRCHDRHRWEPLIARWWQDYQPGEHEEVCDGVSLPLNTGDNAPCFPSLETA